MKYIASHWRGDNSLAWAYWIDGTVLPYAITLAALYSQPHVPFLQTFHGALLGMTALFVVMVWGLVGIWRSAGNSIDRAYMAIPKRSAFWAYTARVMVVIGAFQIVVSYVPAIKDLNEARVLERSDLATQFSLFFRGNSDVVLEGYINPPAVAAIEEAFQEDDRRSVLVLNSPGGLLTSAYELADLVENRGIITVADGTCQSACLLVLAAAERAFVTADVTLAFHHPEAAADFTSNEFRLELDQEIAEYYRRLTRYGVPEEDLNDLRKAGFQWITVGEAYDLHLIDFMWHPQDNSFEPLADACDRVDCFVTPVIITGGSLPLGG